MKKMMLMMIAVMLAVPSVSMACPGGKQMGQSGSHFAMMDSNGDGKVSRDEMQAHRKEMCKQWKQSGKSCPMKSGQGNKKGMGQGSCLRGNDCSRMQGS